MPSVDVVQPVKLQPSSLPKRSPSIGSAPLRQSHTEAIRTICPKGWCKGRCPSKRTREKTPFRLELINGSSSLPNSEQTPCCTRKRPSSRAQSIIPLIHPDPRMDTPSDISGQNHLTESLQKLRRMLRPSIINLGSSTSIELQLRCDGYISGFTQWQCCLRLYQSLWNESPR